MNLLEETIETLAEAGKSPADVLWVGAFPGVRSWEDAEPALGTWAEFATIAAGIDYDQGFGWQEIADSLKVVGADWWLERGEYDGSEWWAFKTLPSRPQTAQPLTRERIYIP